MIKSINLFPEGRYLRMKGSPEVSHNCGGVSSIIIILALIAILSVKLNEAFKMQTIFFTPKTSVSLEPPMINLTTYQGATTNVPYMLAIGFVDRGCSTYNRSVVVDHITTIDNHFPNRSTVYKPITLESCTAGHFSNVPSLKKNFNTTGLDQWLCLPLNQTYQIGGAIDVSNTYQELGFHFTCSNPCQTNRCGSISIIQVSSIINPNSQQPFEYFLDKNYMDLDYFTQNLYYGSIDQNILNTDSSLLPDQQITTQKTIRSQNFKKLFSSSGNSQQFTDLYIGRSSTTYTVDRNYLKLLDVLSYVGGIFPSLFTLFFFMNMFGVFFFEMTFAHLHFKSHATKARGFVQFLKKTIYQVRENIGFKANNWKLAKKQCQINTLAKKMLDINYLYKRIDYLESAISLLLDDHQLKGIYLSRATVKKADDQWKRYRLRDRMLKYLEKQYIEKRKKKEKEKEEKQKEQEKGKVEGRPQKEVIGLPNHNSIQERLDNVEQVNMTEPRVRKTMIQEEHHSSQREMRLKRLDNFRQITLEQSMTEEMDEKEFDELQLEEELEGDLKTLFREAKKKKGDPISKRIVEDMDEWLSSELQLTIDEYERENPRFQYRLRDPTVQSEQRESSR